MAVHFVGFRGDEYNSAIRAFGKPDFIHVHHDKRMYGDIHENDLVVHGPKSHPEYINPYSDQDHERY